MKATYLLGCTLQVVAALPRATNSTPTGCKVLNGDTSWPAPEVWSSALPGIIARGPQLPIPEPDYRIIPTSVAQVQAAINFVSEHNVRISMLNSGHDYLGRNEAPSGLWMDMSMLMGVNILESFTPTGSGAPSVDYTGNTPANTVVPVPGQQYYVTFGVGMSTQQLNDAIAPSGLFTIGAAHGAVAPAGGFGQTAGHAPLSSAYGLGADNIVEFKVVTSDGQLLVANSATNEDLFWALRGGGGGTFGAVIEATVKAYPTPKMTILNWWLNATEATTNETFYNAAAYLLSTFPSINKQGVQGYFYIYPNAMKGIFITADKQSGQSYAESIWLPILEKLSNYTGFEEYQHEFYEYDTYKEFFDDRFGPLCPDDGMAEPEGIIPLDSHLLGATHLQSSNLASALQAAMPQVPQGQLRGHLVGGGAVINPVNVSSNSVNPAWRSAYVHLIATGGGLIGTADGEFNVDSLRQLAPEMGAYANEANRGEPNWKYNFWGANYPALSLIKEKYDPDGVLWVSPGINADYFQVVNGRVCKTLPIPSSTAPTYDNQNYALPQDIDPAEDSLSNFPGTPPLPTDSCTDMKRRAKREVLRRLHSDIELSMPSMSMSMPSASTSAAMSMSSGMPMPSATNGVLYPLPQGFLEESPLVPGNPQTPGATVTKIRYGPYTVDSMGEITDRPVTDIEKPCSGCYVVALAAGLEYEDGSDANIDQGAWLHHMVLYNNGLGKTDLVCGYSPQRIFASGNERTVSRINTKEKYGLELGLLDEIGMIIDLMNTAMNSQTFYLTLTYEWLSQLSTEGSSYKAVDMAWLDAGGCDSDSEITPKSGSYDLTSPKWKSTISGTMLSADGHVHDGGENVTIWKNGEAICISQHLYGRLSIDISATMMDGSPGPMEAISDTSQCENFASIDVGDEIWITAHYDTNAHPIDVMSNGPMDIMGIAKIYIGT